MKQTQSKTLTVSPTQFRVSSISTNTEEGKSMSRIRRNSVSARAVVYFYTLIVVGVFAMTFATPCAAQIGWFSAPASTVNASPDDDSGTTGHTVVAAVDRDAFYSVGAAHCAVDGPSNRLYKGVRHQFVDSLKREWIESPSSAVYVNLAEDRVIFEHPRSHATRGVRKANFASDYPAEGSFVEFYDQGVHGYVSGKIYYDEFGRCFSTGIGKLGLSGTGSLDRNGDVVGHLHGIGKNGHAQIIPITDAEIKSELAAIKSGRPEEAGFIKIGTDGFVPGCEKYLHYWIN